MVVPQISIDGRIADEFSQIRRRDHKVKHIVKVRAPGGNRAGEELRAARRSRTRREGRRAPGCTAGVDAQRLARSPRPDVPRFVPRSAHRDLADAPARHLCASTGAGAACATPDGPAARPVLRGSRRRRPRVGTAMRFSWTRAAAALRTIVADDASRQLAEQHLDEAMLWGRAAGRCQFDGCNRALWKSPVTQERVNLAEKAHIYSFSADGPRGNRGVDAKRLNALENLILFATSATRRSTGTGAADRYTIAQLQQWKAAHEARVARVTGIGPEKNSHILLVWLEHRRPPGAAALPAGGGCRLPALVSRRRARD